MVAKTDYSPGQIDSTGRVICGAKKRNLEPCGATPKKGHKRCYFHGGATPSAIKAAEHIVAKESARKAIAALGYDPNASLVDPTETLLQLVSDKAREVTWLRVKLQHLTQEAPETGALGSDALVWGVTQHRYGEGPEGPIDETTEKVQQNIWWELLHKAEDQLARYSKVALDAGVERRHLELKEAEALMLVGAINQVLNRLSLTPDQHNVAMEQMPAILRSLDPGAR